MGLISIDFDGRTGKGKLKLHKSGETALRRAQQVLSVVRSQSTGGLKKAASEAHGGLQAVLAGLAASETDTEGADT